MANEKLGVPTEPSPESLQKRSFTFVQWSLTFWNLNEHHCFIVLHVSVGGVWNFVSDGLNPSKPPVGTVWHNVICFLMQSTRKS